MSSSAPARRGRPPKLSEALAIGEAQPRPARRTIRSDRPTVTVLLLTYERLDYARATLRAVQENLEYSGPLALHIADDGSHQSHVDALLELARTEPYWDTVSWSRADRRGYGGSYNLATQLVHPRGGAVLPLEDDWVLTRRFTLDPLIDVLGTGEIGCVRLGYIGFTQELRGTFRTVAGQVLLELDPDSPEPHVFAGHPRLETVEWERRVGPWPEGLAAGATEFEVAHRREARERVAWPVSAVLAWGDLFGHIGTERAINPGEHER